MNEGLIEINHLSKRFSSQLPPVLVDVQATLPKGEIIGLVGPDASGKSTLIRLMAALMLPSQGTITVAGKDSVKQAEEIHGIVGYMPQKFGLYEDLTVMQNLNLYADIRGIVGEQKKEAFEKLLHFTGLESFTKRLARNLSGGMKQKLGLACALIREPPILLLDEPSVGVDPISRRELWKMIEEQKGEGVSIVWSTAYLDEAERCQTVLLINEGKLLYCGNPQDFTKRIEGRVFLIKQIESTPRKLLLHMLQHENVMDAVIQGKEIRVVFKEKPLDIKALEKKESVQLQPVAPRFEDAFIEILGGGTRGISDLAKHTSHISGHEEVIVAKNLTKKFGNFIAADNISFTVTRGEVFGLLGPNGAGKSTTFKMLCGLLKPTKGQAFVGGLDLQEAPGKARAQIGYMAQKFSLYGGLSVKQNLIFFSGIYNLMGKHQMKMIERMIDVFKLKPYLNTTADLLPPGYKQRLALACATMHQPKILFLDEPTSGVDPITRREFWDHINGLVEKGVTILVTTHFMEEADYCDRIALIYRGKVIKMETPDVLKDMVKSASNPNPTLEDAFIKLIEEYDTDV